MFIVYASLHVSTCPYVKTTGQSDTGTEEVMVARGRPNVSLITVCVPGACGLCGSLWGPLQGSVAQLLRSFAAMYLQHLKQV